MHFVYILRSMKDSGYYVGMTLHVEKRLQEHNSGNVRSTKSRLPFELVYIEEHKTRIEAREREKYLKSGSGREHRSKLMNN